MSQFNIPVCATCGNIITPQRYAAWSCYKGYGEAPEEFCCGKRRNTYDEMENATIIPNQIFGVRRNRNIRYTTRVSYVIEQLLPISWIANFLYTAQIDELYQGAVFGMDAQETFYLRYTENKKTDKERERIITGRPVRLVRKLLGKERCETIADQLFEEFHNELVARIKDTFFDFSVVEGDDIRKWYHQKRYADGTGSLATSCMRYEKCQDFFKIYTKNPRQIKMLIAVSKLTGKLHGRALLFTLDNGQTFLSRAYANDIGRKQFYNYAEKQGWLHYEMPAYNNGPAPSFIQLDNAEFDFYPYMDSYGYLDKENRRLYDQFEDDTVLLEGTDGFPEGEYGDDYYEPEYDDTGW